MKKGVVKDLVIYGSIIVGIVLIRSFIATPVRVNGLSMYDTLNNGEIMILNKINYKFNDIKRFDIVVVKTHNDKIIKRVIGLPGESVKIENNKLYIDGKEIKDNYAYENTSDFDLKELGFDKIPKGYYFVMGDNRNNSADSRLIGPVKKSQIKGKANLVIFPFKDAGNRK